MRKEEQTTEIKLRLYDLTKQFVYKYQPRYYKQMDKSKEKYEDLISEFYVSFLTEKARVKGKEQSLLDKFDDSVTTLEYLVKVAVQRKLIDWSRTHPHSVSIDEKTDEFGDCILKGLDLLDCEDESVDEREFDLSEVEAIKLAFQRLDDYHKKVVADKFTEVKNVLAPAYRMAIGSVLSSYLEARNKVKEVREYVLQIIDEFGNALECPMQQLTDKTAVVLINGEFYNFDRWTGKARNKQVLKEINMSCLKEFNDGNIVIKPIAPREEFIKKFV